jgi:hypothetical protein
MIPTNGDGAGAAATHHDPDAIHHGPVPVRQVSTRSHRNGTDHGALETTFVALAPGVGRTRPVWIVPCCRACQGAHLFRGAPGRRRAPCGGRYWVGPR